ncbi:MULTISPECIES: carbohydrate ABC transporter permease [unclassified Streptomyces]|jgi:multiple sugar transport system permease protein|uniref:Carbohydrate ABC transporter permease n=2 Tax=Streptomyces TaxID=1883 RepID=A0AAU1U2Q1_9ACTN|nr:MULTISPECIES: carbohydrate ABC transporter permease [unclassified Streptomyces]MCX4640942.1 carbohydrate ABC transporter permease [Streptomyces sp. NBC_01446]MCX5322639.1 carbohydrate ABC transporter permease [Streptomyces sp. NBC_00120]
MNRMKYVLASWTRVAGLTAVALLTLGPVIWTVSTSFRAPAESFDLPPRIIPGHATTEAYHQVFAQIDVWLLALNSTLVTALIAVGQMITAGLAGYAFARLEFRFKKPLFGLVLATMMVPVQVTIVPVFLLLKPMGLTDTLLGLIIPAWPTAFGTFLMRQYFLGMPKDLGEAALIDGAGPWRIFRSVYAPLATPGLAIIGVLAFNYHWNEFFRPLILETSTQNFTLPLGLVSLQGNLGTGSISVVLAGVVLSMIPAMAVFVIGQRPLREGITSAGVNR